MTIDQIMFWLAHATIFMAIVATVASVAIAAFQIFVLMVYVRFAFMVWHWLGVQHVSLINRGQQLQQQNPALVGLQASNSTKWNAALGAVYLFVIGSIVVGGLFALNQPVAWLMLTVLGILFLTMIVIMALNP
jgi:hypothetical protein